MRNDKTLVHECEKRHSRKSAQLRIQESAWADPAGQTDAHVVGNVAVGRQGIIFNDQDQFKDNFVTNFKIIYRVTLQIV